LGLPLFPGTSEYKQVARIVEMLGVPPDHMLRQGKFTSKFFELTDKGVYRLKSEEQWARVRTLSLSLSLSLTSG